MTVCVRLKSQIAMREAVQTEVTGYHGFKASPRADVVKEEKEFSLYRQDSFQKGINKSSQLLDLSHELGPKGSKVGKVVYSQ